MSTKQSPTVLFNLMGLTWRRVAWACQNNGEDLDGGYEGTLFVEEWFADKEGF